MEFARCSQHDIALVERESGKQVRSLDDWLAIIDDYFAKYGRRAVAVKNQNAYARGGSTMTRSQRTARRPPSMVLSLRGRCSGRRG
jgi:hypothetical protein